MSEQLDRSKMRVIGGTGISAVLGVNRWKTPLQLWSELTGQVEPPDLSDNEAVQMGIELEDTVARLFTKKTGLAVRRAPQRYNHPQYPYMSCQVDRLVTGTDELLECKTASAYMAKEWEGEEIPIEYILQVQWQLMLTGRSVGHIAVLIGGQKFVYKHIQADVDLQAKMLQAATEFWMMVEKRIPPVAESEDNSFMVKLFPTAGEQIREAADDVNAAIAQIQSLKAEIIDRQAEQDALEAKLKAVIGDSKGLETQRYIAKWINVKGSTFTVTKQDSRQLRITDKEKNK
jgi:putative phage-type endonuclease